MGCGVSTMKHLARILIMTSFALMSIEASAQTMLPQGIGIYGLGIRRYMPTTEHYNANGQKEKLGAPFSQDFTGENLLDGAGGSDLQDLAQQLKKFDANNSSADSLLNTLKLGKLDLDVKGQVDVKGFGLGYGFSKYITGFVLVPWVTASTDVKVNYVNNNNVDLIRQRVGDLAFEDLKSGFDRAANISSQTIVDSITTLGYKELDHWEYQGLGDIYTGGMFSTQVRLARDLKMIHTIRSTLLIPTGYYDDPDILNDISVGRGYYVFANEYLPSLVFADQFQVGGAIAYGYGLPTQVEKRVPENNEGLVASDRKENVHLTPGSDLGYSATVGYVPFFVKPRYTIGVSRHTRDSYSGSLEGNYGKLSEGSNSYQLYHEPSLEIETATLYQKGKFPIPMLAMLRGHFISDAKNSMDEKYIDLGIASFFSTPFASSNLKDAELVKNKKKRRRSYEYRLVEKKKAKPEKTQVAH